MTGALHEDLRTFMIISRSVILGMRTVTHKICRGKYTFYVQQIFSPKIVPFMR